MRAVLDPSLIVSAVISRRGESRDILREFRAGAFELVTSPRLLHEVESCLGQPRVRQHLDEKDRIELLELLRRESTLLDDPPEGDAAITEDPGDDYLIALAGAGAARAIVSADPALTHVRGRFPILSPAEFLLLLE